MIPTAVIVSRGDVDLELCLSGIPKDWPLLVYDNSQRDDLKVYGHFAALAEVETEYAYFQDDDAICPAAELLAAWHELEVPDDTYLYNEKEGETAWVSWGGICHRDLPAKAISRFVDAYGMSDDVLLWCDLIFAELTPHVNVDLGWKDLPHARAQNRMVMLPTHYAEQARIRELCEPLK